LVSGAVSGPASCIFSRESSVKNPAHRLYPGVPSKSQSANAPVINPPSEWPPHITLLRRTESGSNPRMVR